MISLKNDFVYLNSEKSLGFISASLIGGAAAWSHDSSVTVGGAPTLGSSLDTTRQNWYSESVGVLESAMAS